MAAGVAATSVPVNANGAVDVTVVAAHGAATLSHNRPRAKRDDLIPKLVFSNPKSDRSNLILMTTPRGRPYPLIHRARPRMIREHHLELVRVAPVHQQLLEQTWANIWNPV